MGKLANASLFAVKAVAITAAILLGLLLLLLLLSGEVAVPILTLVHLLFGWIGHALRSLPEIVAAMMAVAPSLLAFFLFVVIAHGFIRWWLRHAGTDDRWKFRHTISAAGLLLLGMAATIVFGGVVHQAAWLKGTRWTYNRAGGHRTMAIMNLNQMGKVLFSYEQDHGHFPNALTDLLAGGYIYQAEPFLATDRESVLSEPWIYLGAGRTSSEPVFVLAVSPMTYNGKTIVLRSDTSVSVEDQEFIDQLIRMSEGHE